MISYIQQWMIIELYKFHPENDDKLYPTMDDNNIILYKFHPESDGKNHPVRDDRFFI